jgi:hypothetical protein
MYNPYDKSKGDRPGGRGSGGQAGGGDSGGGQRSEASVSDRNDVYGLAMPSPRESNAYFASYLSPYIPNYFKPYLPH